MTWMIDQHRIRTPDFSLTMQANALPYYQPSYWSSLRSEWGNWTTLFLKHWPKVNNSEDWNKWGPIEGKGGEGLKHSIVRHNGHNVHSLLFWRQRDLLSSCWASFWPGHGSSINLCTYPRKTWHHLTSRDTSSPLLEAMHCVRGYALC